MKPQDERRTARESRLSDLLAKLSADELELLASTMSLATISTLYHAIRAELQTRKNSPHVVCICGRKWTLHPSTYWSAVGSPCPQCYPEFLDMIARAIQSRHLDTNSFRSYTPHIYSDLAAREGSTSSTSGNGTSNDSQEGSTESKTGTSQGNAYSDPEQPPANQESTPKTD